MSELSILIVLVIILIVLILAVCGFFLYKSYFTNKVENKVKNSISKTLSKNILKNEGGLIPDSWLQNPNSEELKGFLDNTTNTNLTGNDMFGFLTGLQTGNSKMFVKLASNLLSTDSELLRKLANQIGISPGIAKPILITAISIAATFAIKIYTNMMQTKFLGIATKGKEKKLLKRDNKGGVSLFKKSGSSIDI